MKLEGQVRIPSGCAIAAVISKEGKRMSGQSIVESMKPMHDRSNGLGGDFAGYGIYPDYKDFYALHMFFDQRSTRKDCEVFLKERFEIVKSEIIPTRKLPAITDEPIIWQYFVSPLQSVLASMQLDEKEFVARTVMKINTEMKGAYVFSSGKNMGTFKAVGFRGGTGAAPTRIRDNVGIPIELTLAAVDQRLRDEGIRNNVSLVVGGSIRSAADVVKAIALGADACYVATAALLALGCHLCRTCQSGKCNWGIATQRPELAKRLDPDTGSRRLVNLMAAWNHEIKELMPVIGQESI